MPANIILKGAESYTIVRFAEICNKLCVRDVDGNLWEGLDNPVITIAPFCENVGPKCHNYVIILYGSLRNTKTGEDITGEGINLETDAIWGTNKYLDISAVSCNGCDKIKNIDRCFGPPE